MERILEVLGASRITTWRLQNWKARVYERN